MTRHSINIQDGFLFQNLKENQDVDVHLLTGQELRGRIKRFDRFAVVVETDEAELLIYKHAIATIGVAKPTP